MAIFFTTVIFFTISLSLVHLIKIVILQIVLQLRNRPKSCVIRNSDQVLNVCQKQRRQAQFHRHCNQRDVTADKSDFTRGSNRSIKSPIRTPINSSPKTLSKPFDLNRTSFIITFAKTPKMVSLHYTTQFQLSFVFAWLQVIQRYLTCEHSV